MRQNQLAAWFLLETEPVIGRGLTDDGASATITPTVVPVLFVEMLLSSPLRLNTTDSNIDWDGKTWLGCGPLGAIEEVKEAITEQVPLRFSLSSVPADNLALALAEPTRNKQCILYLAFLDPETRAVVDAPELWGGTLDSLGITQSGETATLSVTAEHAGVYYARSKPSHYNDNDQQKRHPGDTSNRFILSQQGHQDTWPAASFFRT
jgi:hypothetical protein